MAQTRELECTKVVVPQVIARGRTQGWGYIHVRHAACCWMLCEAISKAPQLLRHMAWYESNCNSVVFMFALVQLYTM